MNQTTTHDLAQKLLASAPRLLRRPKLVLAQRRESGGTPLVDAVACLWDLVDGCLAGNTEAAHYALRLLCAPSDLTPNQLQDAAAWDAFLSDDRATRAPYVSLREDLAKISSQPYTLFSTLLQQYPPVDTPALRNADVLICQHLLGSIVPQLVAIRSLIPNARFWEVLGKPYSANIAAVQALKMHGFTVNSDSCSLPLRGSGADQYQLGSFFQRHRELVRSSVQRFFDSMSPDLMSSEVPILVIDDGGTLSDAVGRISAARGTKRPIVCIEQTQRGLFATRTYSAPRHAPPGGFAVINIAQSLSKLVLESNLIAKSVIENIFSWLDLLMTGQEPITLNKNLQVGIIGYGAVGESIADEFRYYTPKLKGLDSPRTTIVYDRYNTRTAAARRNDHNIAWSVEELLSSSDIVISATGGTSLNDKSAGFLRDNAILASASSGDMEFQGIAEWPSAQRSILYGGSRQQPFDNIHGALSFRRPSGEVHVLNGGFPVNFNGAVDPIDPAEIQLTRALMLAGVLQAIGFVGQDSEKIVGETGEFLLASVVDHFLFETYKEL
jgi:hypothetical protein